MDAIESVRKCRRLSSPGHLTRERSADSDLLVLLNVVLDDQNNVRKMSSTLPDPLDMDNSVRLGKRDSITAQNGPARRCRSCHFHPVLSS
jgi:hypothetical protein